MIQIDEAHSSAWPRGLPDQPEPQNDFEERVQKANDFVKQYDVMYPVYVDQWNNEFAELFQAWPDKYYCVNKDNVVIGKAEYGTGAKEALVLKDYTVLLQELMEE